MLGEPFPTAPEDVERMIQIRGQEAFEEISGGDGQLYERIEEVFHRAHVAQQENIEPFAVAKPDPEQVSAAIAALGADPARSLHVGDGPTTSTPAAAPARSPSPSPSASTPTRRAPPAPTT